MLLVLSSPCLTRIENVPNALFTFAISHLTLSADPDTNDPSEFEAPESVADVELLYRTPSPKVFICNTTLFVAPLKVVVVLPDTYVNAFNTDDSTFDPV